MAMEQTIYRELKATPGVWQVAALLMAFLAAAAGAWFFMEHHGHAVTGMDNQIVWGLPHVFAIFLIVAASGALNVASIASVFGQTAYKPRRCSRSRFLWAASPSSCSILAAPTG